METKEQYEERMVWQREYIILERMSHDEPVCFEIYDGAVSVGNLSYAQAKAVARLLLMHDACNFTIRGWFENGDFDHFVYNPGNGTLEVT